MGLAKPHMESLMEPCLASLFIMASTENYCLRPQVRGFCKAVFAGSKAQTSNIRRIALVTAWK